MDFYISFEGVIDPRATEALKIAIEEGIRSEAKKIIIFFSSLGGSIYEGFILASLIQNSQVPINIHATNHIDSIANVIYASAKERTSESYAKFYMHGASAQGVFDEKMLKDKLTDIQTNNSRIAYFISENSLLPLKKVKDMMETGTTISAQDALKYSIVHEIAHKEIPTGAVRRDIIFIN